MFYHHRSFFPAVLVILTVALAGLMIWKLPESGERAPVSEVPAVSEPGVTEDGYRASVAAVLQEFYGEYAKTDQDFLRLMRVEKTLDQLLDLKVTEGYKELHLDLVVALNQWRNGLRGETSALKQGQANLEALLKENPWLKP